MSEKSSNPLTPVAIIIAGIIIAIGIFLKDNPGVLGFDNNNDKGKETEVAQIEGEPARQQPKAGKKENIVIQKISVDDDPVLGDPNAPVTIVEFSDYECPFCRRHFRQTYPELKKEYIDTGKVKLVYRDLPLSFHDPAASKEAEAAECVREQGGDKAYFEFHNKIFESTGANGTGIDDDKLYSLASDVGVDSATVRSCVTNGEKKEEVIADKNQASSYGATGTPTFFIGKSSDGDTFDGEKLVGAQPLSEFKKVIEKYLGD